MARTDKCMELSQAQEATCMEEPVSRDFTAILFGQLCEACPIEGMRFCLDRAVARNIFHIFHPISASASGSEPHQGVAHMAWVMCHNS